MIETIYVADISLSFKDESGASVTLSGPALAELKAKLGGEFSSSGNGTITGKGLAVGFQTSPDILRYVLTQVK